jgi:hypothetical protein
VPKALVHDLLARTRCWHIQEKASVAIARVIRYPSGLPLAYGGEMVRDFMRLFLHWAGSRFF